MQLEHVEALIAPAGQDLLRQAVALRDDGQSELRIGERLRRQFPAGLVAAALAQIELRERARVKFTRAARMLFTRAGLEQASSEVVAGHRAVRLADGGRVADLCTGIGGDLVALAGRGPVTAVDVDAVHARVAGHNAEVYGVASGVVTVVADARSIDTGGFDTVFVDPARRVDSRRLGPGASEPPLAWCFGLADLIPRVAIKAAPGLPASAVPDGWEREFVADGRDLKEAVLWSPGLATAPTRATLLPGGHQLVATPGPAVDVRAPGQFLIDPNPAVTRAGLVEDLARRLEAWKIDPRIAFLSTDADVRTPFGRTLPIRASLPWRERNIAAELRRLDVGSVDIRRRGLAGDVERARHTFRLSGTRRATVAMTRVDGRPWALICLDQ